MTIRIQTINGFENWVSEQSPFLRSTVFLPTLMTLNPAIAKIDAATLGGFSTGFVQGGFDAGINKIKNFNQLLGGQFKGSPKQVASRHLWEPLQNAFGLGFGILNNNIDPDIDVNYFEGATVVTGTSIFEEGEAITIGSYISGRSNDLMGSLDNNLFMHEYGHYIQSQSSGPLYLHKYGLPSLVTGTPLGFDGNPDDFWVERDANRRGFQYFEGRATVPWNTTRFPQGNTRNPKWWEPFAFFFDPLSIARYNRKN